IRGRRANAESTAPSDHLMIEIGAIYVTNDRHVVIDIKDAQVREDLARYIHDHSTFFWRWVKDDLGTDGQPTGRRLQMARPQRPGDPLFLDAIHGSAILWNREFGGYHLSAFVVGSTPEKVERILRTHGRFFEED
ncbi:MAG: hypothetical protein HYV77_04440, partial [Candidatus Wildermuthbacteria bacterium]|nr:hypothetical protein [Candidatus Wildermuthbacteria bacterium]